MKTLKYLYIGICSTLMLTSCLSEFQDLNTDPEQLGTTDPRNVFTGATLNFNNCSRSHLTGKYSGTMIYMQYLVSSGGASAGSYISLAKQNERPQPYGPAYSFYYNANGDGFGGFGLRLDYLIHTVIPQDATPERYNDVKAVAQILLNYEQWLLLDTYGAAPITEAFRDANEGIRTPRYDLYQESIDGTPMYKKIDAEVKGAIDLLNASNADQQNLGNNDFFYFGDIQKWIKFGNTLRVKMAQRLEKADKAFYESVINEVLTSANNIISNHEESCIYNHPNDYNNVTDDIQNITSNYVASAAFVNYLKAYDDPRLPIMVRPNGFGPGNNNKENDEWFETFKKEYDNYEEEYAQFTGRYVGMSANPDKSNEEFNKNAYLTLPYTKEDGTQANLEIRMHSQAEGRYFVKNGGRNGNNNMPGRAIEAIEYEINQDKIGCFTPILTYPETCLMLAEIALKKGAAVAGKNADAWYREGIRASIEQYRNWATKMYVVAQTAENSPTYNPVTDEKITAYLARPEFQTATLEKIISQQWINLYMQPEEMWATWKRTGLPAFKDEPVPANGVAFLETIKDAGVDLIIPRRNSLGTPNTLNIDNYNKAVEMLKQDTKYGAGTDRTEGRIWWDVQ
ncbi:SusD/RagB family nutrient-binding outer membrane lipoprotein [Bacteroides sp. AN502(2024)]|uniref:SusD/RagB family nutrient-binding outer membrane lipoprotein n=1 Tax=Bacteroides sp. AN502(2024) TaxID=3160599 RepID=UPI00351359E5